MGKLHPTDDNLKAFQSNSSGRIVESLAKSHTVVRSPWRHGASVFHLISMSRVLKAEAGEAGHCCMNRLSRVQRSR
ncbi:uncharacterized protein Bfra_002558 [Botrytis fragariae]|uniref:Uncharacterized protein n=1 Tax=Botrytis fragariae TaxID=1964551 RepID=A0A8H6AYW8_9HELO|nr:uncharacterized protein Bfra_002558 [Botrytis fragariae]KAF5876156.1 hypothetical protein Bfra_002558 [Botrytis fragariae]